MDSIFRGLNSFYILKLSIGTVVLSRGYNMQASLCNQVLNLKPPYLFPHTLTKSAKAHFLFLLLAGTEVPHHYAALPHCHVFYGTAVT